MRSASAARAPSRAAFLWGISKLIVTVRSSPLLACSRRVVTSSPARYLGAGRDLQSRSRRRWVPHPPRGNKHSGAIDAGVGLFSWATATRFANNGLSDLDVVGRINDGPGHSPPHIDR